MSNLKRNPKVPEPAKSTCSCEFLNTNGSCALARPAMNPNFLKVDTIKGICELNGQPISDVTEMTIKLCPDNEAEVTLKMFTQLELVVDNCSGIIGVDFAASFSEFKAKCEEVAENFYSGSENASKPESLSKGCKPAPLSASEISKRNATYDAVQHRNKEYAAQLSDEECLKVSLILEMLCGSNIKDSKKILDFCNTMLAYCKISSDFAVEGHRNKTNLDDAIRCSVQACHLQVPDKLEHECVADGINNPKYF